MPNITWPVYLASQFFSTLALVIGVWGYLHPNDNTLKMRVAGSITLQAVHFALLGKWGAFLLALLSGIRWIVSRYCQLPSWGLFCLFMAIGLATSWWRYQGPQDVLLFVIATTGTIGLFLQTGLRMRAWLWVTTLAWLAYNVMALSLVGSLGELFYLTTNAIGIWRVWKANSRNNPSNAPAILAGSILVSGRLTHLLSCKHQRNITGITSLATQ